MISNACCFDPKGKSIAYIWGMILSITLATDAHPADRPNIVLIMCDDMGWSDLGCYGGEVETPNLDRLADRGLRFSQFYNNAKCTTTRASILTGLYPRPRNGLLKTNMVTIGEALAAAGYQTALCGKWHLGRDHDTHPFHRGFQEFYGLLDGCCNFFDPSIPDPPYKGSRVRHFAHNERRITEFPEHFYTTDAFTDHAIKTISRFAEVEEPFFLHLCYTAPHYPLHAKPQDIAKYRGKFLQGWDAMRRGRYERLVKLGLIEPDWELSIGDSRAYDWETADHEFEDQRMAVYAAMIDSMDQNIGRLMRAMTELDIVDNTLVMFLSDNGGCAEEPGGRDPSVRRPGPKDDYAAVGPSWGWAQNAPFRRYKSWTHEGGISTPLIVHWPGHVKPGTMTHQVGHIIDILPTCLDVAEEEYPQEYGGREILPIEGKTLLPIFEGRPREGHAQLFWEWSGSSAIREGEWKAVWDAKVERWELYDLDADRTETNDLVKKHPELLSRLAEDYDNWAQSTGNRRVEHRGKAR